MPRRFTGALRDVTLPMAVRVSVYAIRAADADAAASASECHDATQDATAAFSMLLMPRQRGALLCYAASDAARDSSVTQMPAMARVIFRYSVYACVNTTDGRMSASVCCCHMPCLRLFRATDIAAADKYTAIDATLPIA